MGFIYQCTNLINNKIYIGQTTRSLKATKADKIDWDQYTIIEEKEGDKTTKVIFKDKETGKEYEMKVE